MRATKFIGVAVLAGVTGMAAGCTAHAAHATARGQRHAPGAAASRPVPAPQLTPAGARQVFAAFLPGFNAMVATGNAAMISRLTTGPESAVQDIAIKTANPADAVSLQPLTDEKFYIPRVQSYPRWFAVTAKNQAGDGLVMLMVQTAPGVPWREAEHFTDALASGNTGQPASPGTLLPALPDITVSRGYAIPIAPGTTAVPGFSHTLTMAPGQVPAGYAAVLNGAPAAAGFMPGPLTSGWVVADQVNDNRAAGAGWTVSQSYQPSGFGVYALRTHDGCTLTFFSVTETQTWKQSGAGPERTPVTRRYVLEELAIQPIHADSDETGVKMVPAQGGGLVSAVGASPSR